MTHPSTPVRGRALMQKYQRGETLTPEESAYLDRVRAEIRRRTAQKRAANPPAATNAPANLADWSSLVPLTDLTNTYKGQDGGLYGAGQNEPPAAHRSAWLKACAQVQPLDAEGHPAKQRQDRPPHRGVLQHTHGIRRLRAHRLG